jgi:hypothetical protein
MNCGLIDCYVDQERPEWGEGLIVLAEDEPSVTSTFELSLWSQPSSDAVLSIVSGDTSQVTVYPETLTFTSSDWNSPQTVTITVVDDDVFDDVQFTTVTVSGVGSNWIDDGETLWVVAEDDDGLDWHLHREGGAEGDIEVSESGSTYVFQLWLWSQPSSDAVLSIVSDDTGEVTVSPATLTFTGANWESAQSVILTGVDDTDVDGDQTTTVTVSGVGEGWQSEWEDLSVVTLDDDTTLPTSLSVMFDSGVDGEAWGNGTFTRCTATPCGHLDVTTWSGREIYVKVSGHSQDPNDDWYYAYIFMRIEERWEIQFVEPGPYAAHRGIDAENPWGDWGDLTVTANY